MKKVFAVCSLVFGLVLVASIEGSVPHRLDVNEITIERVWPGFQRMLEAVEAEKKKASDRLIDDEFGFTRDP